MVASYLEKLAEAVTRFADKVFDHWGTLVYRRPGTVALVMLVLFCGLIYGFFLHEMEADGLSLWIPIGSESLKEREAVEQLFPNRPRAQVVYVTHKDGDSVISLSVFQAIYEFHQQLQDRVSASGFSFPEICYKLSETDTCRSPNHPLEFLEVDTAVYDLSRVGSDAELLELIQTGKGQPELFPEGSSDYIYIEYMFGSTSPEQIVTHTDGSNNLSAAQAVTWVYELGSTEDESVYTDFEVALEEFASDFNKANNVINAYFYTSSAIDRMTDEGIENDLILVQIGITFIVLYVLLSLGQLNTVRSRALLGMVGVISVGIAYVETISVGSLLGIKGSIITQVLPFIMLGIGVDDMFVLVHTLDQAPEDSTPEEQFKYMIQHAGPSISLTSLTNIVSFLMGSITTIPAIRYFCFYASLSIFFDYLNQITLFAAVAALDVRRSDKAFGDCCGAYCCKPDSKICCHGKFIYDSEGFPKEPWKRRCMRRFYGPFITSVVGKIVTSVLIIGFVCFNCYQASLLRYHFDYEWFVPNGTYLDKTIQIRDQHFERSPLNPAIYSTDTDFAKASSQQDMLELTEQLANCEECEESWVIQGSTSSWYLEFNQWVENEQCSEATLNEGVVPESSFSSCLEEWLATSKGKIFLSNLVFAEDSVLEGSAVTFLLQWQDDINDIIQIAEDTRGISKVGPGYSFPYHFLYHQADQASVFVPETLLSLSLTILLVAIVVLVSIIHLKLAVYVMTTVLLTCVAMLGMLQYTGVFMSVMTMTNIIISIGITVDFSIHIVFAYKIAEGQNSNERVVGALTHIGASVIDGAFSTFLALLPLVFAQSFAFGVFFNAWVSIIGFGLLHSIGLLPILLGTCKKSKLYPIPTVSSAPIDSPDPKRDSPQVVYDKEDKFS